MFPNPHNSICVSCYMGKRVVTWESFYSRDARCFAWQTIERQSDRPTAPCRACEFARTALGTHPHKSSSVRALLPCTVCRLYVLHLSVPQISLHPYCLRTLELTCVPLTSPLVLLRQSGRLAPASRPASFGRSLGAWQKRSDLGPAAVCAIDPIHKQSPDRSWSRCWHPMRRPIFCGLKHCSIIMSAGDCYLFHISRLLWANVLLDYVLEILFADRAV